MVFSDWPGLRSRITFIVAVLMLIGALWPRPAAARNWLDFPLTNFNIYSADNGKLIGRGHYSVSHPVPGQVLIHGENRYFDGEYDIENDLLDLHSPGDSLPTMNSYNHTFYNPDGTHKLVGTANTETGAVACNSHDQDGDTVRTDTLEMPADTFAGAALVVPIERALSLGLGGPIQMHVFDCTPTPRVIALKVNMSPSDQHWQMYPGDLVLANAMPDLGFLNFIAAPFLPTVHAWFDPREGFLYIGGEIHRYLYGDERILVVKNPNPVEPGAQPTQVIPDAPSPPASAAAAAPPPAQSAN